MVAALRSARLEGIACYRMRIYTAQSVFVIDELGYMPLDQASTTKDFRSGEPPLREGSILLTSNRRAHS